MGTNKNKIRNTSLSFLPRLNLIPLVLTPRPLYFVSATLHSRAFSLLQCWVPPMGCSSLWTGLYGQHPSPPPWTLLHSCSFIWGPALVGVHHTHCCTVGSFETAHGNLFHVVPNSLFHHEPLFSCRKLHAWSNSCPSSALALVFTGPFLLHFSHFSFL